MKKLIIAAAVSVAVYAVNAAQFMWYTDGSQIIAGYEGGSGAGASGNGYLLWDNVAGLAYTSAQDILTQWAAGTVTDLSGITDKAYGLEDGYENPLLANGGVEEALTPFGVDGAIGNYYALFVTKDATTGADWAYLTTLAAVDGIDPYGSTEVSFSAERTRSAAGTGWYTQSVPEPTSGLLLLVGMAGLALRRRRA